MVISLKKDEDTSQIFTTRSRDTIGTIRIRKGTVPNNQERTDAESLSAHNRSTIEILDQNDRVIYTRKFAYQDLVTVPMKQPGQADDQVTSLISTLPETTVILPYLEEGRKIRVIDEEGQAGDIALLEEAQVTYQAASTLISTLCTPAIRPGIAACSYSCQRIFRGYDQQFFRQSRSGKTATPQCRTVCLVQSRDIGQYLSWYPGPWL